VSRTYKTEGIIIKRQNLGEADRLLTIFTKHFGKIKAIAKGVRQLKSRKAGSLELFNQAVFWLAEGKSLDIITDVKVVSFFDKKKKDLKTIEKAFKIAELIDCLTVEKERNTKIFTLLKNTFSGLERKSVVDFEIALLKASGFGLPKTLSEQSLDRFVEQIIEKQLKSRGIWSKI